MDILWNHTIKTLPVSINNKIIIIIMKLLSHNCKVPLLKFCVLTMAIVRKLASLGCVRWRRSLSSCLVKPCAVHYQECGQSVHHNKNQVFVSSVWSG